MPVTKASDMTILPAAAEEVAGILDAEEQEFRALRRDLPGVKG